MRRSSRSETLRATLAAYFGSGQNAASAAALLGVHERTIANRLRAIEAQAGRPVATRRAELEMALRLRDLLATPASRAARAR
jgi:DNA-binding PucR family transcriptional regulator